MRSLLLPLTLALGTLSASSEPAHNDISCGQIYSPTPPCVVVDPWAACPTEDGLFRLTETVATQKMSVTRAMASARTMGCDWLRVGEQVQRLDLKFFNQTIEFRRVGRSKTWWTHQRVFWPKD